ncbi:MAG: CHASE2 domain-containing protein [Gammaproteobacteria bacterium]|nr:CHASE2 domain-containing protein [Gammaproteobacteria bacterium]
MTSLPKPVRRLLRKLRDNLWLSGAAIALLSATFTFTVIANLSLAQLAENHFADMQVAMLSLPRPQSEDITIVLIDEKTVMKYPYRSPLDRSLISDLLQALEAKSVAAIGINVLFDRPTEADKDLRLYQQLRSTSVPVVLSKVSSSSGFSAEQVWFANEFVGNLRTGLSLIYRDPVDHTVRASLLRQVQRRTVQLGFAATLADAVGVELPPQKSIAIDYRMGPDPFTPPFPIYAAHEVAALPAAALENRIVLIGSDLGSASRLRTPLSVLDDGFNNDLPGVVIEAHILSQLIENRSRATTSARDTFLVTLLMAAIGCIVSLIPVTLVIKLVISLALLPITCPSLKAR